MSCPLILYSCHCRLTILMASLLSLRDVLNTNKLIGPNYIDWLKNLRIVLTQEKVFYILDTLTPDSLGEDAKGHIQNVER